MAPSPENDNAPKAPDKNEKPKCDSATTTDALAENKTTSAENKDPAKLDDSELKHLLEEAISYKNPKDRIGKSPLFQNLLNEAEEDDRKARATSASGSELVRYYNTSATRRSRHHRKQSSVSENLTHGGSLNNLAKEELYESVGHSYKMRKTVSARQREGGSLPCNVNSGTTVSYDKQFFDEVRKRKEDEKMDYTTIDMESESLLEHDSLNQNYLVEDSLEVVQARLPRNVDDGVCVPALEHDKPVENEVYKPSMESITAAMYQTPYSLINLRTQPWNIFNAKPLEEKKVDENGNALGQNSSELKKGKKKKIQADKNVVVLEAKDVEGHRGDIINDLDKLVEFIGGNTDQTGAKAKSNVHKSKLNKHVSSDDKNKKRTRPKGKTENLKKSNSLEEISTTVLEDFTFVQDNDNKVSLRATKSNADRPRERRSWGNTEQLQLYGNVSMENLETADFRVVTKKKKSKKRRNSVSGRRQTVTADFNRVPSPEPRRKSACSVPHSEKSNDSSDVDSVHSLPIDTDRLNLATDNLNLPISYADIAKNSSAMDKPKWNPPGPNECELKKIQNVTTQSVQTSPKLFNMMQTQTQTVIEQPLQTWPHINNKNSFNFCPKVYPKRSASNNIKNLKLPSFEILQGMEQICEFQAVPDNIPDVQTIEKMHFKQLHGHVQPIMLISNNEIAYSVPNHIVELPNCRIQTPPVIHVPNKKVTASNTPPGHHDKDHCDSDRTSSRPAVVILSGDNNKDVSGLTFGFDINEQLLSDDVCDNFVARFNPQDHFFRNHNYDKIVSFVGLAWEDIISQTNGKIQYYSDHL